MAPDRRVVAGVVLSIAGAALLWWVLFSGAFAPKYVYDLDPIEQPGVAEVHEFESLSPQAQRVVEQAVGNWGTSVTLRGEHNRVGDFEHGHGCPQNVVRYEGRLYGVCAHTAAGSTGAFHRIYSALAIAAGLVLVVTGLLTIRQARHARQPAR